MKAQKRLKPRCPWVAKTFGAAAFGLLVVSCSGGVPSEGDARDVFAGMYRSGCFNVDRSGMLVSPGGWRYADGGATGRGGGSVPGACPTERASGDSLVRIESFSKVNAQRRAFFGYEEYVIEYRATISWPQGHNTACTDRQVFTWDCWMHYNSARREGERETLTGTITFEKTERGWRGENGQLY